MTAEDGFDVFQYVDHVLVFFVFLSGVFGVGGDVLHQAGVEASLADGCGEMGYRCPRDWDWRFGIGEGGCEGGEHGDRYVILTAVLVWRIFLMRDPVRCVVAAGVNGLDQPVDEVVGVLFRLAVQLYSAAFVGGNQTVALPTLRLLLLLSCLPGLLSLLFASFSCHR